MSGQSRLASLISSIGADIKTLTTGLATVTSGLAGKASITHKYHPYVPGEYLFDNYEGGNQFRVWMENATYTTTRFRPISNVEYWDGSAWVAWAAGIPGIRNLLDGNEVSSISIDHAHRKFRFTVEKNTGWPTTTLVVLKTTWCGLAWPGVTVSTEQATTLGGTYTLRDTAVFTAANGIPDFGIAAKAINTVHNGDTFARITIDINDWVDNGGYVNFPIYQFEMYSNYGGVKQEPWAWDYYQDVFFNGKINASQFNGSGIGLTGLTSAQVGLSNVDNTTDTAKPVSTAQQTALNLKANLASPTFTGTVSGVSKAMVGLTSVDDTSDANKPVSSAQQTALNLKANLASPAFTGTPTGITATHVGLGSVNNTADTAKPVSTAQQTALNLKADLASPAFTGTPTGITKTHVGLGSVDNTADTAKPVSTAQQTALNLKANLASPAFTGTPTGITATHVGLGSVNNTADTAKPVSTAQQTALDLKANLASPAFTGTPTGITKAHVGLGSADNTADTAKPVSTAQAAADSAVQAYSIQRGNHTGTQLASTISDFDASALSAVITPIQYNTVITTSSAPEPNGSSLFNKLNVEALAENATIGVPTIGVAFGDIWDGNSLVIRIKDNGTSRTIGFNAIYRAVGVTLPTATVANKTMYIGAKYNGYDSKWDVIAVSQEA